ncbi:M23 family metallopeptidase [Chamaesiphon sp.]|uniref:M23 family metallopeptidase n=1 Tax=Chamaesiphon sp. TaxID=2814140 RepID=UPI003594486D
MRINTPLRLLVITGAFLSAKTAFAQNSFSSEQVLVASNTLKTQLLSMNRLATATIDPQALTADQDTSKQTGEIDRRFGFDDDSSADPALPSYQRLSARPTQSSVFSSDVATLGNNPKISVLPSQLPENSIEIAVPNRVQSEASIEIPVPFPRTQIIKVQPVTRLPRVSIRTNIPTVSAIPTVRTGAGIVPVFKPTFATNNLNQASSNFIYPLMNPARVTSRFGWRTHPLSGTRRFHSGIDIGAPTGTPVVATGTGTVISAGWNGGYGKAIIIQHNDVQQTLYGHLSQISVQPGQVIEQGTVIGLVGSTGNSTGPHLHFETRMPNGDKWVAIDPSEDIQYAVDNLRRSMPFARKDLPQGL